MMSPEGGKSDTARDHGQGEHSATEDEMESTQDVTVDKSDIDPEFQKQLTDFYKDYLKMKDAFVESDAEKVAQHAGQLQKSLDQIEMGLLKGEAHMQWMDYLKVMEKQLGIISGNTDMEKQRQAFVKFNPAFFKAVDTYGLSDVKAYYQFCPMANDDQGAYWISSEKQIRNPYYGDQMLTCGEVRREIGE